MARTPLLTCFFGSLSVLAVVLAGYAMFRPPRSLEEVPDREQATARMEDRLKRLEEGLARVNNRLAALRAAAGAGERPRGAAEREDSAPGDPGRGGEIARRMTEFKMRLEELATKVGRLEAKPAGVTALLGSLQGAETPEETRKIVETGQAAAQDRSLAPAERLEALKSLRGRNGRTREITAAMVELLQDTSLPAGIRADIIRNLSGLSFEELKQPLLIALQSDPDPETRSEAVETLESFYADPVVHGVVENARDNDADPRVRAEAFKRLRRHEERKPRD